MAAQLLWKLAVIMLLWSSASCVCIGIGVSWSGMNPPQSNDGNELSDVAKAIMEDIDINSSVYRCLDIFSGGKASKIISNTIPSTEALKVGSPNEPSSTMELGKSSKRWVRKIRCR